MSASEVRFATGEAAPKAPDAPTDVNTKADGTAQFGTPKETPPAASPDTPPARPAWLPEKFKTPEDFAKSYAELEKRHNAPPPSAEPAQGFDVAALSAEYREKGELSAETLNKLEKQGIPRAMALGYIKGQEALAAQQTSELASVVDGPENLKTVLDWAGKNLTAAEIDGYNALIDAGNLTAAKYLLSGFASRFAEANGSDPTLATTGANTGTPGDSAGYQSSAEMIRDMKDPRYQNDPAYRQKVRAKIARTTAF